MESSFRAEDALAQHHVKGQQRPAAMATGHRAQWIVQVPQYLAHCRNSTMPMAIVQAAYREMPGRRRPLPPRLC